MRQPISSRDWEHLSAYLDDALAHRERETLAARLESEPDLDEALENLSRTRALLRLAPQAQPPRHFTLRPDMVRQPGGLLARLPFSMNALTAVASLLLVVVLVGDILAFGSPSLFAPASSPVARETAAEPEALIAPADAAGEAAESGLADDARATDTDEAATEGEQPAEEQFALEAAEDDVGDDLASQQTPFLSRRLFTAAELGLAVLALLGLLFGRAQGQRKNAKAPPGKR
jgi:hypothetical protein